MLVGWPCWFHFGHLLTMEMEMDKKEKTPEKVNPIRAALAAKQQRWPGQNSNAGIKNARSVHDRKPAGRGASRGR